MQFYPNPNFVFEAKDFKDAHSFNVTLELMYVKLKHSVKIAVFYNDVLNEKL